MTLIVDSQSAKGAETVSKATRGFGAGKRINGRKRHIAVGTLGLPVMITVTPADTTDRDVARELLWRLRVMQPRISQVWADSAYAGQLINWSDDFLHMTLKSVSRPREAKGFVALPRRWKAERTLGWIMKARRNVRDYERLPQHSEAHLTWALITLMTRRIARTGPPNRLVQEVLTASAALSLRYLRGQATGFSSRVTRLPSGSSRAANRVRVPPTCTGPAAKPRSLSCARASSRSGTSRLRSAEPERSASSKTESQPPVERCQSVSDGIGRVSSNAQDLWIGLGLDAKGRTFPSDQLKVTE